MLNWPEDNYKNCAKSKFGMGCPFPHCNAIESERHFLCREQRVLLPRTILQQIVQLNESRLEGSLKIISVIQGRISRGRTDEWNDLFTVLRFAYWRATSTARQIRHKEIVSHEKELSPTASPPISIQNGWMDGCNELGIVSEGHLVEILLPDHSNTQSHHQ